jgi:hypothetical protein
MAKKRPVKRTPIPPPSAPPQAATWGHVVVEPDKGRQSLIHVNLPQAAGTSNVHVWCPDKVLRVQVPNDAKVVLHCETARNGERRFSPIGTGDRSHDPFMTFYAFAFSCGLAILIKSKRMTPQQRQSYRTMWFLFQRAQKMRQHIRRIFNSKKDLLVARSGWQSGDINEKHILPWPFDSTTQRSGYPQSVKALLELGAESAQKAGIPRPRVSQKIHFGLAEVAKLEPNSLALDAAARVLRSVLFDVDPNWKPIAGNLGGRGRTGVNDHLAASG